MLSNSISSVSDDKISNWTFSDRPVGIKDNRLWQSDNLISDQIEDVAQQIAAPLIQSKTNPKRANSFTFAVHGRWGCGKTSFITMALERARRLAGDRSDRLLECWYQASAFEGTQMSVRAALAMQVLMTFANGDRRHAIRLFSRYTDRVTFKDETLEGKSETQTIFIVNKLLETISSRLAEMADFGNFIEAELSGQGDLAPGQERVMVIVVDDLDRCSPIYVGNLLDTIQQWSNVSNLYFVIAVDREVLHDAIVHRNGQRGIVARPDVTLEKYIQYSVEIPELSDQQLAQLVDDLLMDYSDVAATALKSETDILARGIRIRTARGVKRCLNTIRSTLARQLANQDGESIDKSQVRRLLKTLLLEYTWRDFYRAYYQRAEGKQNQFTAAIIALERASVFYVNDDDREQFGFSATRIRQKLGVVEEEFPIDTELARFLALEPWFFLAKDALRMNVQDVLAGIVPANQPESRFADISLDQATPLEQIGTIAAKAQRARKAGDRHAVLECLQSAVVLLQEHPDSFGRVSTPAVGNLALYAEELASATGISEIQQMALFLYSLAYRLDVGHINNRLNFADFILDSRYPPLGPKMGKLCIELLGGSAEIYQSAGHLMRWMTLRVKFAYRIPEAGFNWVEYLNEAIDELSARPSFSNYTRLIKLMELGPDIKVGYLESVARKYISVAAGQERERALLLYADTIEGPKDSLCSMEVYRYILRPIEMGGIQNTPDSFYRGNAMHNYAVNLREAGYLHEAARMWYEAYQIMGQRPDRGALGTSYSIFLTGNCERPDLAKQVENSQPLNEMALPVEREIPVPEHFVEGGIQALFDILA